jgi:hypothetical protein
MARIPYYQDPVFIQKAAQRLPMGQTFASPFSATTRNVSAALEARRNQAWSNQMGMANAEAGRRQAQIGYGQAWQGWQGNVNRSARNIQAQEQLAYQRRLEEMQRSAAKKARRRGMLGSAIGAIGTIGGGILGGPVGAAVGGSLGNMAGSSF